MIPFNILIGIILITVGMAIVFAHSGVILNSKTRKIEQYTWVLFLKIGKWESLEGHNDVIVLRKKRTFGFYLRGVGPYTTTSQIDYEIFIANRNHLSKVLICRRRDKDKAYLVAREIADQMNCEFVRFNPGRRNPRKVL